MRKRLIASGAAALVTGGLILLAPASPAAAHSGFHTVEVTGTMHIVDDDWPDSDDIANPSFNAAVAIGPLISTRTYTVEGCSDEVRIQAQYRIVDTTGTSITVDPVIRMYEGSSCGTTDLDGITDPGAFTVAAGGIVTRTYRVNNTAEGGDWADVTVTIRNLVS